MDIEWKEPSELEEIALSIIRAHQPSALCDPEEIDILNLINRACNKYGYTYAAFPLPKYDNKKALGCVDNKNKKLLLDVEMLSQAHNNVWMFVAAHELGHLVLHRKYFENGQIPYDCSEIEAELPVNKQLEWQANRFASELLLPRAMVHKVVNAVCLKKGITNNFGKIYLDGKSYNYDTLNYTCGAIKSCFSVSKTVAQIRLKELNLIIDERQRKSFFSDGTFDFQSEDQDSY